MTNFEKIKAMSVEEMADLLDYGECRCCIYYNENGPSRCDMHECIEGVIKLACKEVGLGKETIKTLQKRIVKNG